MATPFRFLIALMGCLHLCGGQYGVLQGIAWTQMLFTYSAEEGWIAGAKQTFDGEHPCGLCLSIADAKQKGSDPEAPGHSGRSKDSGLELKPCPLTSPLLVSEPKAFDGSVPGLSRPSALTPIHPSAPEPPPPRGV